MSKNTESKIPDSAPLPSSGQFETVTLEHEDGVDETDIATVIYPETNSPMSAVAIANDTRHLAARIRDLRPQKREQDHKPIPFRLKPLQRLAVMNGRDYDLGRLKLLEQSAHPYSPSVGIEVEVYPRQLLTPTERNLAEYEKDSLLATRLDKINAIHEAGIPLDESDPWPEFALEPARHPGIPMAELRAIRDAGVLHIGEVYLPMHVTLGGIHLDGDARLLARAMEASGLSTTARRLLMPTTRRTNNDFWTTGDSGLHDRADKEPEKITAGAEEAVEFRTFTIHNEADTEELLNSMYWLGTALSAYQDFSRSYSFRRRFGIQERNNPIPVIKEGVSVDAQAHLAAVWIHFSTATEDLFEDNGLRNPTEQWKEPGHGSMRIKPTTGDFGKLADILANEEAVELSLLVRALIHQACAEIRRATALEA